MWKNMPIRLIYIQAIVLGADEELALWSNNQPRQSSTFRHFVGDDIRAELACLRKIAVEGIAAQEPDVALFIRLDVAHSVLHPHSRCPDGNQLGRFAVIDMESLTVTHIDDSIGFQDSLALFYFLHDWTELTISLSFLKDSFGRSHINGIIITLKDIIDVVGVSAIATHLKGNHSLAIVQAHAIARAQPDASLVVGHDTRDGFARKAILPGYKMKHLIIDDIGTNANNANDEEYE